ncbi:MAG: DUF3108 domain-containing protein [Luteolibacter sp.]
MKNWCLAVLLPALPISTVFADEPAWKSELTSPALGPHANLAPTVLDFELSWNGTIDSGKLRIEFAPADAKKPDAYVVRSSASSLGAAAALFPYKSNFWSELDPATFRPKFFHSVEIDQSENVTTDVRHFPDRVECSETTKVLKTGVAKTSDKVFKFAPVFDIFSAMLHIRSQKLDEGDKIALVVCPFKTPYLLRVSVKGREVHNGRDSIRMTLGMRKIDRKTMELLPYKKLKQDATLWLSDDDDRVPIEFRAAAFIGDVRATLTGNRKP